KRVTLPIAEFARRFLLHVLPTGFVKIRHYGLFAAANIPTKWAAAHALRPVVAEEPAEPREEQVTSCAHCSSTNLTRVALKAHATAIVVAGALHIVDVRGPPGLPHHGEVQ